MGRFNRGFNVDPKVLKKKRQFKSARLIIRNLSFSSTEQKLKEHFSQFGKVLETTLLRRGDKLVGCGFIQFDTKANAAAAIQKASGKEFLGRIIVADWALPKDNFVKSLRQEFKKSKKEGKDKPKDVKEEVISCSDDDISIKEEPEDGSEHDENKDSDQSDKNTSDEESDSDSNQSNENLSEEDEEDLDDEEQESDLEGEDDSDADVKPDLKKIKKRKIEDVLEGKTVFIKNIPFMATEDELKKAVQTFGPIFYAKICMDQLTEHSKGTAFVKFQTKESADACLAAGTEFTLNGTVLDPHPALPRKEIRKKQSEPKKPSDSRNLFLLKEGVVTAGSKAAEGVSASDMAKRLQIERWKREIIKDLGKFVSRYRLVIHNIPLYFDDKKVAALVKKYCPKTAKFREVRVMRDLKEVDATGTGKSKGFAFVSFEKHEDALATLRSLNNNPSVFKTQKRPIVSFSIESKKALKIKEARAEKSRQPKKQEAPTILIKSEPSSAAESKPNKKGKGKRVKEAKGISPEENLEKVQYAGTYATPGTKKFLNNLNAKQQAFVHRKQLRKEKTKVKNAKKKPSRKERKAQKQENMTKPKKSNREDVEFSKLVDKYRAQISNSESRKKWFD